MIGQTNAIEQKRRYAVDENTLVLITDSIEDKSLFHSNIQNFNVTEDSNVKRDNRNSLYFKGDAYLLIEKYDLVSGGGDWTIECWVNFPTLYTSGKGSIFYTPIINSNVWGTYSGLLWGHTSQLRMWLSNTSNNWNIISDWNTGSIPSANSWNYMTLVRQGQVYYQFLNGNLLGTKTVSGIIASHNGVPPALGRYMSSYGIFYLQDFKVSNIARYTASFTPPQRFI